MTWLRALGNGLGVVLALVFAETLDAKIGAPLRWLLTVGLGLSALLWLGVAMGLQAPADPTDPLDVSDP